VQGNVGNSKGGGEGNTHIEEGEGRGRGWGLMDRKLGKGITFET